MAGYGGLPYPLAGPDHRQRRPRKWRVLRRLEPEVGALVAQPGRKRTAREPKAVRRREHRLVREVDDDLGPLEAVLELLQERDAVVRALPALLRAAGKPGADALVRQD